MKCCYFFFWSEICEINRRVIFSMMDIFTGHTRLYLQVFVRVRNSRNGQEFDWTKEKFLNRAFAMKEMYQNYACGESWEVEEVKMIRKRKKGRGWCVSDPLPIGSLIIFDVHATCNIARAPKTHKRICLKTKIQVKIIWRTFVKRMHTDTVTTKFDQSAPLRVFFREELAWQQPGKLRDWSRGAGQIILRAVSAATPHIYLWRQK